MPDAEALLLYNGVIRTVDARHPIAAALAVRGDRILFVGQNDEARQAAGRGAHNIDLRGACVLPGLADAHCHMAGLGQQREVVDLRGCLSLAEAVERVASRARSLPPGEWVMGRGWDQERWDQPVLPAHRLLSRAVPDHPTWLVRVDAHAGLANARAMQLAGITRDTPSPEGGSILKDAGGEPTGLLLDAAMRLVDDRMPQSGLPALKRRLLAAQEACLSAGLTEVHDAGIGTERFRAYAELAREGALKLRVYAMARADWQISEPLKPAREGRLTMRCVKVVLDGALGSGGAALLAPYSDAPGQAGLLLHSPEEMDAILERACERGLQTAVHAIGDRANRIALDAWERLLARRPAAGGLRYRIEHAQIVSPDDLPRFSRLGVIASMQPTHATSDMRFAEKRLGRERLKGAYAWRMLTESGARLAGGSDFPVESHNPLLGLHAAITRQDAGNNPPGGWLPEERLTVAQAVRMFTTGAAYAAFEETERGMIAPGLMADLTVLDTDPFACDPRRLLEAKALLTLIGGEVVYRNSAW